MSFTDERLIRIYASLQNCHHFTDEQIEKLGLFAEDASVVVGCSPVSIMEKFNDQINAKSVQEQSEALSAIYLHPRIYDTFDGYKIPSARSTARLTLNARRKLLNGISVTRTKRLIENEKDNVQ